MNHDRDDDGNLPQSEAEGEDPSPHRRPCSCTRYGRERSPLVANHPAADQIELVGITLGAFVRWVRSGPFSNAGREELGHRKFSPRKCTGDEVHVAAPESVPPSSLAPAVSASPEAGEFDGAVLEKGLVKARGCPAIRPRKNEP